MAEKKQPYNYAARKSALKKELENNVFHRFYLVCGEEDYLRRQDGKWLADQLLGSGDPTMNRTLFTGKDFTADDVIGIAETMPFFADRRVIVLEETYLLEKAKADTDKLVDYMRSDAYPDSTKLVFVQKKVENRNGRLYRTLSSDAGSILECPVQSEETIRTWVLHQIKERGFSVENRAMALFLDCTGTDMLNVKNELEKLMSYCEGTGKITLEDVKAVTTPKVTDRIYDMIEAITRCESQKALAIYADLLELNEAPARILWNLTRQYNELLCVQEMAGRGLPPRDIAAALKLNPWVVSNRLLPVARQSGNERLRRSLELCARTDMRYKSGKISDRTAVETLIVTCAAKEGAS